MSTNFHFLIQAWRRARSYNLGTRVRLFVMILVFVIPLMGANHGVALAAGTTYYVDNTNPVCSDSGPGTMAAPLCTITRGDVLAALPGDTVHVLAGTYVETVIVTHSGAEGNPITFHASPGVTVTGNPGGFGSAFAVSSKSYVVIDGFNITETKFKGIYVDGSNHITITNNNVSYAGKDTGSDQHQQGIFLRNTTYSTISGNVTHHNSCIGIRLINNSDYNTVSNNISYANSSAIAHPVVVISDAAGIELTGSSNNTVSNNITYGNEDTGINLYVNSSGVGSSYNLVVGNLSYGNGDHGIDNNNSPYNTIIGNTVHGNGTVGINFEGTAGFGSHHATVMNNISTGNGFTPPAGSFGGNMRVDSVSIAGTILDYNLYNRESASVQIIWNNSNYVSLAALRVAEPSQEVHGLEGDPLFMQPVESVLRTSGVAYPASETTGNYHLSPGSPAIDSANSDAPGQQAVDIEGNARIDDPATTNSGAGARTYDDRGAYEYQPSGSNVAPVVTTQAATLITQTTALGNGTISSLGVPNPTQHGFVWSTSVNPTIADDKTTEGSVSETGAFTSAITGLMPGTLYHVRAYATNAAGTAYGADMTFTTLPATTVVFNTSGTWVAPAGVTSVTVEVWGGGGRGGGISSGSGEAQGGGGGGGAYSIKNNIPVTPGNSYSYVVGTGSTSTSAGGNSYFINISTVFAQGGNSANSNTGVSGGAAASGVGDVKYSGGSGANGSSSANRGGGGGSSAGTTANGSTATDAAGATAPSGGGNGGNARSGSSGNGTAGSTPGGAGGGAYRAFNASGSYSGGAGANGQIRITYYVETRPTTTSVNCGAGTPAVTYGDSITCVATVSASSGTPTGTVSWSTGGAGSFVTSPCNLSSGSCSVSYTPSSVGSGLHLITANYTGGGAFLPSNGNQSVTVNPKALTINGVVAEDKTYDGTMTATLDLTSAALVGVVAPDIVAFDSSSVTSTFASANAGTWGVTASGFGLSGADISNYTLPAQPVIPDATILPKAASVTPNAAGKVYGEDDPALTGTLTGFLAGDNVTATYSRAAGETVAGGPYTISAVLAPAGVLGNYTITYNTAAFTILPKAASVTPNAGSKVYGEDDPALTGTLTGFLAGDNVTATYSRAAGETVAGGPYTISAVLAPAGVLGNYTVTYNTAAFTITPKTASVTPNAGSKVYGSADPALTGTLTGFLAGDNVTATYSRVAGETVAGGPYTISAVLAPAGVLGNYTIIYNTAAFTITPKTLTITGVVANNKVYDGTTAATFSLTGAALVGVVAPDVVTINSGSAAGTFASANAGTWAVTASGFGLSGADVGNYTLPAQPIIPDATILPKAASVTPNAGSKVYGEDDPALTGTLTGFLAGDNVTATYSRAAGETVAGGPYTISAVLAPAGVLGNYTITYNTAAFTILPKAASVTPNAGSKVYGEDDPALTGTLTGFLAGDNVTATYSRAAGETVAGGPYTISAVLAPAGVLGNYTVTYNTAAFTITPKTASVTPNAGSKVYGSADPALTGTLTGFLAGDNVTATYSRVAGETVAGGPYTISAVLAPAGVLGNYTVIYNTAAFTITPKTLTITGVVANNKVYDGTTAATFNLTGAALVGVVAPDVVTINSGSAMGAFASANAGTWAVTASGFGLSGAGAGNYTLAAQPVLPNATITPKAISVTANAASKFYGAVDPVLTYTSTPLAGGDSFSGTLARAAGENVGIYAINQGTLTAGSNYIITFTGANLTVNPLAITVTADAGQMKAEGAADPAEFTYAVNPALVGSDTFSGALTRELGETPGFYAILVGTLSAGANYDMTFVSNNFEIVANQAPVITEGADIGVTMSKNGFPDKFALTLNATDAEAHTLTWSIQTQAGNGTATATGDGNSKVIAYAPTLNFSGADSFVVRVTDQLGAFDDITVNVTVSAGGDFPTFVDVPMANSAWSYIESIYYAGITGGCSTNPLAYCPNSSVTRAQMAIFLLRGMYGQAYTPPPATGTVFADVPLTHSAAAWIEQLAAEGITGGCGNGNYCPSSPVTRAQMAIFLLRAKYGDDYVPPAASGTEFLDVPIGHSAAAWIEQLAAEGITGGCGGGNYCPNQSVTRAQMAIFIQRTFDLARP